MNDCHMRDIQEKKNRCFQYGLLSCLAYLKKKSQKKFNKKRLPSAPRQADRLTAVVVFPTPPFWLAMAITLGIARFKGTTLVISRHSTQLMSSKLMFNQLWIFLTREWAGY